MTESQEAQIHDKIQQNPVAPGAYALQLSLSTSHRLDVGRLGEIVFPAGEYVYLGSARGPGGLRARLGRHILNKAKESPHWHIDYLRQVTTVLTCCYLTIIPGSPHPGSPTNPAPIECLWSQALAELVEVDVPVPGFGASDCNAGCPAHLVKLRGPQANFPPRLIETKWLTVLARACSTPASALTPLPLEY